MKRLAAAVGAVVVAILLFLLMSRGEEPPPSPPAPPPAPVRVEKKAPEAAPPAPVAPAPDAAPPPMPEPPVPEASGESLSVSGRVTFPDGNPVPGMGIQATGAGKAAVTDESGRYEIRGLASGQVELWLLSTQMKKTVDVGAAGADFVVEEHIVRIRILDGEGEVLERVSYTYDGTLGSQSGGSVRGGAGSPRSRENLTIASPTGMHLVYSVSAKGRAQQAGEYVVEGAPRLHDIPVVMKRPGEPGFIALHAVDDQGMALPKVHVTIEDVARSALDDFHRREVKLDADGRATLAGVPAGSWRIKVDAARGAWKTEAFGLPLTTEVKVEAGQTASVDLLIRSGGRVRVTVLDGDSGVVRADNVWLMDEKGKPLGCAFWGSDGEDWTWPPKNAVPVLYEEPIPPGRYSVEFRRDNAEGKPVPVGSVTFVVPVRQVVDVEIRLAK